MGSSISCDAIRESLSARLDNEPAPLTDDEIDAHAATCSDCRSWFDSAQSVSRLLRVREVDLAADTRRVSEYLRLVVPAAPRRRWLRWPRGSGLTARVALAFVGASQLMTTLLSMLTGGHEGHVASGMATHFFNESSAWNLALGAGFLIAASFPRLAAGLIPTLLTFLVVLAGVSIWDLARGDATAARVASHILPVAGALLLIVVNRAERRPEPPMSSRTDDAVLFGRSSLVDDPDPTTEARRDQHLPPTGRRTA